MTRWNVPNLSVNALDVMRQVFGDLPIGNRLSSEQKDAIYAQSLTYYKQSQFDNAQTLLILLRLYAPMDYRYALLQGLCFKQQKEFEEALVQLRIAAMVDPSNPEPFLHAAECLMADGSAQEAEEILQQVLLLSQGNDKYRRLAERAEGWLALAQEKTDG